MKMFGAPYELQDLSGEDDLGLADTYFDRREFEIRDRMEDEHYWHIYRCAIVRDWLRNICPDPRSRLIELGCGIGTVSTFLNQHGYHVDYSDIHVEALQHALAHVKTRLREREGGFKFVRLNIARNPPPRGYKGVLLLDVLEHVPDDERALRNVHTGLREAGDGAFVLFTVPAFQILWSPWDEIQHHKRRYTLGQARGLAERAGFEVVRAGYFFSPLLFCALGVKALRIVRNHLLGTSAPARDISDLMEGKSSPMLNRAMLALLSLEQRWFQTRPVSFGTSIICVARPRSS